MNQQEYKLKSFDVGNEPYVDNYGNTWATATFEGITEPVKWVVQKPSSITVGETYYGHMEEKTSKANKPYTRFYKDQRPEGAPPQAAQKDGYQEGVAWGNALTNAVSTVVALTMIPDTKTERAGLLERVRQHVIETAQFYYDNRPGKQLSTEGIPLPPPTFEPADEDVAQGEKIKTVDIDGAGNIVPF